MEENLPPKSQDLQNTLPNQPPPPTQVTIPTAQAATASVITSPATSRLLTPQTALQQPLGKIPVIRTYEHDLQEAIGQNKISSASITIAEKDKHRKKDTHKDKIPPPVKTIPVPEAVITPVFPPPPPVVPTPPPYVPPITNVPVQPPPAILPPAFSYSPSYPPTPSATAENSILVPPVRPIPPRPPVEENRESRSSMSVTTKFFMSLILILAGLGGAYYLYLLSSTGIGKGTVSPSGTTPVTQNSVTIPSIVTPDTQKIIDVTDMNTQGLLSAIVQNENTNAAGMVGLVFEETSSATTTQVSAYDFISKVGMNPPDAFSTSLDDDWMFGTDNGAPFMIFTSNFFQNTFAGMLAWEPTLPGDLSQLFSLQNENGEYQDRILDNKNIREYVGTDGTPIFLYGFIDNKTLVITRDEATFSDIVGRIEKQTYVR